MTAISSHFAGLYTRLALLAEAATRRLAALRFNVRSRLDAARAVVAEFTSRAVAEARTPAARARGGSGPAVAVISDRVRASLAAPEAPATAARAYLAAWVIGLVARLVGAPAVLLALLSLARGALMLALVALAFAPALGHPRGAIAVAAGLRAADRGGRRAALAGGVGLRARAGRLPRPVVRGDRAGDRRVGPGRARRPPRPRFDAYRVARPAAIRRDGLRRLMDGDPESTPSPIL